MSEPRRTRIAASLRMLAQRFEAGDVACFNVSWLNADLEPTTLCWPGDDHIQRLALSGAIELSHDVLKASWGEPVPRSRELKIIYPDSEDDDGG